MNTVARRKASADYHAKLRAEGHKKVTLFLSPEALAALGKLATGDTSKAQAVNAALIEAARRVDETKALEPPVKITHEHGFLEYEVDHRDQSLGRFVASSPEAAKNAYMVAVCQRIVASAEAEKPWQGLKGDGAPPQKAPKPTKTPAKTVKPVREAAEPVVGAKLDIPVGPQPFKARLKTPKGSK